MGQEHQMKNEEEYLEPAMGRLKDYWADVFATVMRGKKRGDGLMIAEDRLNTIEEEIDEDSEHAFNQAKDEVFEEHNVPHDMSLTDAMYNYEELTVDPDRLKDDVYEKAIDYLGQPKMKQMYAIYIANEIKTSDRGSFVSVNNLFNKIGEFIEEKKALAVATVFARLRTNPEYSPPLPQESGATYLSRLYGDSDSKAKGRARMRRDIFKSKAL